MPWTYQEGSGSDLFVGSATTSSAVSYAASTSAVSVDLGLIDHQATGGAGDDILINITQLVGSGFNDVLKAGAASATVLGEDGDDTLFGGIGNDYFSGGAGNDAIDGGGGIDIAILAGDADTISFSFATNGIVQATNALGEVDIITNIEQISFDGSPLSPSIDLSELEGIYGTAGIDSLV